MTKRKFINIHIQIKEENYDPAIGLFSYLPITGIEEKNDELILSFLFNDYSSDMQNQIIEIITKLQSDAIILKKEVIEEKNWNEEWESKIETIRIGNNITISPSWKANEVKSKYNIIINPKMAFGTGDHSTTKLICQMLENCVKRDSFWIDIGTGTGILSILAIMLGAKKVIAIDNDNWAIENAKENLMVNKLSDKVELIFGDVLNLDLPKATGICANLSISLIQKCWNKFHLSLVDNNGDLIISGILIYDKEKIITEARKNGFKLINFIIDEEWIAFNFKVRD